MKAGELARALGLEIRGDKEADITHPASIEAATSGAITFISSPRYAALLSRVTPACIIVTPEMAEKVRCAALLSSNPNLDFTRALQLLYPPYRPPAGIHPTAVIAPDAQIGEASSIGAYVVIGSGVRIGQRAVIHPQVTVYPDVTIGDDFLSHSQVSIREGVIIGNRVVIHNGAVIGSDGFGFLENQGILIKIPQVGNVVLEDDVELGSGTTIDRATIGSTVIRHGVKMDNLVHIGHNCEVGACSRFAAQVGIAGSVKIGQWCEFGGQTGTADHSVIGDRVRAAGKSGLHGRIQDDVTLAGVPAVEIGIWRRYTGAFRYLPSLLGRIRKLERKLAVQPDPMRGDPDNDN